MSTATNPPQPASPLPPASPALDAAALAGGEGAIRARPVMGETRYDRVTSMMMAAVIGMACIVSLLWLVLLTNRAHNNKITADIQIVEVVGGPGGGGIPDGAAGETGDAGPADASVAEAASNGDVEPSDFQEPSFQQVASATLDMTAPVNDADSTDASEIGTPASGSLTAATSRSRVGLSSGRPGMGNGGYGDGGVRREQRWSVVYNPGQTLDEYARQLDAFGVEIGVIQNNAMRYVSKFSGGSPASRFGQHSSDNRLFFVWQSNTRKGSDVELLRRAGVEVGESPIFHFYPKPVEERLAQYEARYKGRQPIEIRATRFSVVSKGGTYDFAVLSQDPMNR
ncbi:MAG: hypothetical protein U0800_07175 [Isosphaeraceae bacterium]